MNLPFCTFRESSTDSDLCSETIQYSNNQIYSNYYTIWSFSWSCIILSAEIIIEIKLWCDCLVLLYIKCVISSKLWSSECKRDLMTCTSRNESICTYLCIFMLCICNLWNLGKEETLISLNWCEGWFKNLQYTKGIRSLSTGWKSNIDYLLHFVS